MWYFWWGCRRTLKLITLGSESVKGNSKPIMPCLVCWKFPLDTLGTCRDVELSNQLIKSVYKAVLFISCTRRASGGANHPIERLSVHLGILSRRYANNSTVLFAKIAGLGLRNGFPASCRDLSSETKQVGSQTKEKRTKRWDGDVMWTQEAEIAD